MAANDKNNDYEVGLGTKLAYSVGALCDSIKTLCFTMFLLFYYTTVLGLPGRWLALAMAIGLVWDAFIDPLIGHVSDRTKLRFGRRHSFMLVGAVCTGVSLIVVFNPPSGLSSPMLFTWLLVSSFCLRTSISLFMVPYYALGSELTANYHERTSIAGFRAGAVIIGTLLAIGTAFHLFLPNDAITGVDSKFAATGYASMGIAFGLAIIIFGLIATFGTLHERSRLNPSSAVRDGGFALRDALGVVFHDASFRVLTISNSLFAMATAINAALAMHFLTYHARIDASQAFSLYFAALYLGALAGIFVWVRVSLRIEKYKVFAMTTMVTALVLSSGYWLIGEGRFFGTGNVPFLIVMNALAGFFGMTATVLVPSMIADIIARDEYHTGQRRDGIFFGIYSLCQQFSAGLAILIAGVLLDHFAGLAPAQADQSTTTVERLAMISNLLPAGLLAIAGIIALRYRLTQENLIEKANSQ